MPSPSNYPNTGASMPRSTWTIKIKQKLDIVNKHHINQLLTNTHALKHRGVQVDVMHVGNVFKMYK